MRSGAVRMRKIHYQTRTTEIFGNHRDTALSVNYNGSTLGHRLRPLMRIMKIIHELKLAGESGVSLSSLCHQCRCSAKTIRRDIIALIACDFEIININSHKHQFQTLPSRYVLKGGPF